MKCKDKLHPNCGRIEPNSESSKDAKNKIRFTALGELGVKVWINDQLFIAPINTNRYRNTMGYSLFGKIKFKKLENGLFQTNFRIGSEEKVALCRIERKQIHPLILGMQTLLEFGFCFGIGKSQINVDPIPPNPDEDLICFNNLSINQQKRIKEQRITDFRPRPFM